MQQHFNKEQLQQIYEWEQKSGKVANIVAVQSGFTLHHIEDTEHEIVLCFMEEEYMLRRWTERLGYVTSDGKTSKQYDEEHGKTDPPSLPRTEIYRNHNHAGSTTIDKIGDRKFAIVSGEYALVANRTASNSYEILLLDDVEYAEYLNKKQ